MINEIPNELTAKNTIKKEYFRNAFDKGKQILFARYDYNTPNDIGSEINKSTGINFMPLHEILCYTHKKFAKNASCIVILDFEYNDEEDITYKKYIDFKGQNWFYASPKIKVKEVKNLYDVETFKFLIEQTNNLTHLDDICYKNIKDLMDIKLSNISDEEKLDVLSKIK